MTSAQFPQAEVNSLHEIPRSSGVSHSFDTGLAQQYGINEALIINHLAFWITHNKTQGKNFIDGRTWSYQTYQSIADHFGYLNYEQVKYAVENLVLKGVLIKGNYNKSPIDKTSWFAFAHEAQFIKVNSNNSYERENSPSIGKIPHRPLYTDTKPPDTKPVNQSPKPPKSTQPKLSNELIECLSSLVDEIEPTALERLNVLPIENVRKAVKVVTEPGFVPIKTLSAALIYYAFDPTRIKSNAIDDKVAFAHDLWSKCKQMGKLEFLTKHIEYVRGSYICETIQWTENGFNEQLENMLRKMGEL
jgi:hypothetical protein